VTDTEAILLDMVSNEDASLKQFVDDLIESDWQVLQGVVSFLANADTFQVILRMATSWQCYFITLISCFALKLISTNIILIIL